jgi:hypothetical protein
MSMHKTPLSDIEREGLEKHGLGDKIGQPSQLADVFRSGVVWGLSNSHRPNHVTPPETLNALLEVVTSLDDAIRVLENAKALLQKKSDPNVIFDMTVTIVINNYKRSLERGKAALKAETMPLLYSVEWITQKLYTSDDSDILSPPQSIQKSED